MMYMAVNMDGINYRVRIKTDLVESFDVRDGSNGDTLITGETIRDVLGTYYNHAFSVEPDPAHPEDYDAFYEAISAPVGTHTITLPHVNGTMTYEVMIYSGSHRLRDTIAGHRRYTGLSVECKARKPYRLPEGV